MDVFETSEVAVMEVWLNESPDPKANASWATKAKVGVLRPVQQPGSYWDRSSELPLVGLEPTEVTAYD